MIMATGIMATQIKSIVAWAAGEGLWSSGRPEGNRTTAELKSITNGLGVVILDLRTIGAVCCQWQRNNTWFQK